jgi:hypothetical protein
VDIPGAIDYSGDDFEDLYFLEHDWSERDEPWAPSRAALETAIHQTASRLASSVRDVPDVLVHAIATST